MSKAVSCKAFRIIARFLKPVLYHSANRAGSKSFSLAVIAKGSKEGFFLSSVSSGFKVSSDSLFYWRGDFYILCFLLSAFALYIEYSKLSSGSKVSYIGS